MNTSAAELNKEVMRRRTFAIISHPDAGKTTLTEKLLLYGGAIHLAGAVKAKASQRHTTSDWMEIEKQRGISISTSVLQFEYGGIQMNLLDTPGHKDFSEDTYRTLMAADAAVMLIDAAKGVEPQTKKLFEVCRARGIPIFTFINKMDRPTRLPLDLIDELEKVLGIRSCPVTWPIGLGDNFKGVFDRQTNEVFFFNKYDAAQAREKITSVTYQNIDDPTVKSELELLEFAGDRFDLKRILNGNLTPVFFGSAMNNFGVEHFLQSFIRLAPPPCARMATAVGITKDELVVVEPTDTRFSGFIFKIQANMDPRHRDRVAFMRVCSGRFERGMKVSHVRLQKDVRLSKPLGFFGQERMMVERAWPGDIIGLLDTGGEFRIGDTLCSAPLLSDESHLVRQFAYQGVPSFSPEHFASINIKDPMKRKQLKKGLDQLSEEGVIQVYQQASLGDKDPVLGAVGALQFEVLEYRLKTEYSVDVAINKLPYTIARWVRGSGLDFFKGREDSILLKDRDDNDLILFKSEWNLSWSIQNVKNVEFEKR